MGHKSFLSISSQSKAYFSCPGPDRRGERNHFIYSYLRKKENGWVRGGRDFSADTCGEEDLAQQASINDLQKICFYSLRGFGK